MQYKPQKRTENIFINFLSHFNILLPYNIDAYILFGRLGWLDPNRIDRENFWIFIIKHEQIYKLQSILSKIFLVNIFYVVIVHHYYTGAILFFLSSWLTWILTEEFKKLCFDCSSHKEYQQILTVTMSKYIYWFSLSLW